MAAVLACGSDALLSHSSAAALWGLRCERRNGAMHVSVLRHAVKRVPGVVVHRRAELHPSVRDGIPVTDVISTVIDAASVLTRWNLEAMIKEGDQAGLFTPDDLRAALAIRRRSPGMVALRDTLDRDTFVLTESELERRFVALAREAGMPLPETGRKVSGWRVDFFWPELGLVVETDGLRYHRTPAQQARDRRRDQAHVAAGLTRLRFTHAQVAREPAHVQTTLQRVAHRLGEA
jgi:hypothetical protein